MYSLGSPSWDTGEGDIYQLDTVRSSSPLVDDEDGNLVNQFSLWSVDIGTQGRVFIN